MIEGPVATTRKGFNTVCRTGLNFLLSAGELSLQLNPLNPLNTELEVFILLEFLYILSHYNYRFIPELE